MDNLGIRDSSLFCGKPRSESAFAFNSAFNYDSVSVYFTT